MGPLELSLAVLVAGGVLGLVDQGIAVQVEAGGGQAAASVVKGRAAKGVLGLVGIGLAIQTLSPVVGDEATVAGDVT